MTERLRVSLQTRILMVVLLCVTVPVLTMGAYLLRRNEEVLGEKVRETLSNQLFRKAAQLDDWLEQRLRDAARWSASFVVVEGVESLARRPGGDNPRARLDLKDYLESVLGHYRAYESLFVVDLQGRVLSSTSEEELGTVGTRLLQERQAAEGPIVSPIYHCQRLGRPTLLVMHAIQGRAGERTIGYLVERVDLRELESILSVPSTEAGPVFWLLEEKGGVVVRAGRVADKPGEQLFPVELPAADNAPVGETDLAGLGSIVYGLRRLEGPLAGIIAATYPTTAAYQPLAESRNRLLKVGLPGLALALVLTFFVARSMVRPIHLLSEAARRVSAGDLEIKIPVSGNDELADLTGAFNEMAGRILEGRRNLESARDELARANLELTSANKQLEELAKTDGLTGLFNRRHFQEILELEMQRAQDEGASLSLLLLDLDHFKQYNDRWGHTEGDAELRRVAAQVLKSIRSTDTAYRYGGEELAVLLPACVREQATRVAEKIRAAVSAGTQRPGRFGGRTTVSIGVATFPQDGRVGRGLIDAADAALYRAKADGRDRVRVAGADRTSEAAG